ncbi:MAG: hypothetical protein ACI396_06200, partial [Acutalibacteraceae bacterium]
MLVVSAIMLSTATYAWFTMNKEVEVTGLKMQATAGDSLEISLGAYDEGTSKFTTGAPTKVDKSWKRAIDVDQYYAKVGKLKPASSDDATKIYYVPEAKVEQGGRVVVDGATITAATSGADLILDKDVVPDTDVVFGIGGNEGYYIDVPMWIRTNNNTSDTNIGCKVTITDPNETNGSELVKAVRVAILPTGKASDSNTIADLTNKASGGVVTIGSGFTGSIFANDTETYNSNKVIGEVGEYHVAELKDTTTIITDSATTPANVFTIPQAGKDDYAEVAFIARVWIEGESTSCYDATANQDWEIRFDFSIL